MKFDITNKLKHRLILSTWSILLAFTLLILNSCTMPQSIDGKNINHKKIQNYKLNSEINNSSNLQTNNSKKISDTANLVSEENIEHTSTESYSNQQIPTLRQQMNALNQRQDNIDKKIEVLTSQVNQLSLEIQNLKNNNNSEIHTKNQVLTGEEPTKTLAANSGTLLSDETISKKNLNNEKNKNIAQSNESSNSNLSINSKTKRKYKKSNSSQNTQKPINNIAVNKSANSRDTQNRTEELTDVLNQVDTCINQKNFANAENILLTQLNKESNKTKSDTIKIKLAECYLENGDIVKAKAIYQEVLKSNPKSELTPIAKKMLQQL